MARRRKLKTGLETMFVPSTEGAAADSEVQDELEVLNVLEESPATVDDLLVATPPAAPESPPAAGMETAPPSPEPGVSLADAAEAAEIETSLLDETPTDIVAEEEEEDFSFVAGMTTAAASEAEAAGAERQLVILTLSDEWYGVDIAAVEQIIELQRITPVPHTPPYIAGLTNLRGTVLPVVDLRRRLGLPVGEPTRDTRIMVAEIHQMQVGMIVDAVTEVLRVADRAIEPPSPLVMPVDAMYIGGIAKITGPGDVDRLVVLLDLAQILPDVSRPR